MGQTAMVSKKVNKKIIVFESDDWGSIRTPKKVHEAFHQFGIDLNRDPYHRYDTLESPNDLEHIYELLKNVEKENNRRVLLTLNYVMCNPDFDKIKASNYQEYYPETFSTTYSKYWGATNALEIVNQGIRAGYFKPQLHGREHVHVPV